MSLSGGTAYVDVALGKTADFAKGIQAAGEQGADVAKSSFLSRIGSMAIGSALGNALTTGVSGAFTAAKGAVFDFNSQLQQADIGFTTMLGSSKAAGDYVAQLQQFAKTTPFEFGNLVQNAQQMMGMGIAAKDMIPDLRALGDSVASIGGSAQQVDSVTLAFDQMNAKGTLDMGNMNQLMQNGVPSALKVLAAHYKVTTGEMIQMISTGKVQSSEALPALVNGIEKGTDATAALGGMMDKQSRTMAGALSNIKDSATQAIAGAFKPVFDAASGAAQGLANVLGSNAITNASKKISDGLITAFSDVGGVIDDVRYGFAHFEDDITLAGPFQKFGQSLHLAFADLENVSIGFKHAADYGGPAGSTFEEIGRQAHLAYDRLQPLATEVFGKIEEAVRRVAPVLQELFLDKVATIKTIVGDAIPVVENIAHTLGPILGDVLRSAGDLIEQHLLPAFLKISEFVQRDIVPAVMDFVSFAVEHVMPLFRDIADVITQKVAPEIGKLADLFTAKVLPALRPLIKDGFAFLKTVISELTPIVQDLVHWFADNVLPVLSHLAEFLIGTLIPFIAKVADVLLKIMKPSFEITVAIIRDVVIPIVKGIADVFLGLYDAGVKTANGVIAAVKGIAAIAVWWKDQWVAQIKFVVDRFNDLVGFFRDLPGKMASAGAHMWDWIKDAFKSAINTVIGWWDSLSFGLPKVHIPGTNVDVGGGTIGVPQIPKLAAGGLVLPTPGGTVVRVAEAGEAEIVAPERALQAAISRALADHRGIGRDSPLIGTVNMPDGVSADEVSELLYFKATARGVSF